MKLLLFSLITLFTSQSFATQWTCIATNIRSDMQYHAHSKMLLDISTQEETVKATIFGHVNVGMDSTESASDYYSVFNAIEKHANPNYRPRVYKNHIQFKNLESVSSSDVDGGYMWGDFIISKKVLLDSFSAESIQAHYVFKSGDHLGGTIDYTCTKW